MSRKPRRKPVDQRKLPHVRALVETYTTRGLSFSTKEGKAHAVFWDCGGDWDKTEKWFTSPKVQAVNGEYWNEVRAYLFAPENRAIVEEIFGSTMNLYLYYSSEGHA